MLIIITKKMLIIAALNNMYNYHNYFLNFFIAHYLVLTMRLQINFKLSVITTLH